MRLLAPTLVALSLAAQPAPAAPPQLAVKLYDGAIWTQTVTHSQTDVTVDGRTSSWTMTSVNEATYRRAADGVATLRQEVVSAKASAGAPREIAASASFRFPVVMEVHPNLVPKKIVNWTELQKALGDFLPNAVTDPKGIEATKAAYAKLTPEAAAATLMKELVLLGLGQGSTRLEVGQPMPYEDKVPNAFGGPPINTHGTFHLVSYDAPTGRAVLTWSQTMDAASAAASMQAAIDAVVARAAPADVEKVRATIQGMTLDRTDTCRFEIDAPTGLATAAECTLIVRTGTPGKIATRTERYIYTQTLPGPR